MEDLLAFLLAGLALTGSPGPATLSMAATGAAFGARRGLLYLAGISLGMLLVMTVTASGVVGLLLALPGVTPAVSLVAAAYFLWLAWRIATAPPLDEADPARQPPRLPAGILLALVNPKAYAAMAALFSSFLLVPGALALDAGLKIALLSTMIVGVNLAWLLTGAALTRLFREPRANRAINLLFAALLLASIALALLV